MGDSLRRQGGGVQGTAGMAGLRLSPDSARATACRAMTPPPDAMSVAAAECPASARSEGPLPALRARIATGAITADPAQELAAEKLQDLWRRTRGYDPKVEPPETGGFLGRFFRRKAVEEAPSDAPLGLYLVGQVGRGKSMLMDLFFASADVTRKQRLHFHQFMQQAHRRIHAWRKEHGDSADPIPPLADSIVADAALLCFDEFQVHDIADAMILGRLFEALFARGVVIVATSNTQPDDLFKGKPGRDAFLPFIALIKKRLEVLTLDSARDYRRDRIRGLPTWHVPPDGRAERAMDAAFAELTGDTPAAPTRLTLLGRAVASAEDYPDRLYERGENAAMFERTASRLVEMQSQDYLALPHLT